MAQNLSDGDELLAASGFEVGRFNQVITLMEISGKIRALGGGKWIGG